ncbi:MAG TPA: DUF1254 domain-containing protein [Sphingomicrobium sp.]|nr:DUF1254 domain-containing protein [Sphingomicrobium sp.]
MATTIDANRSRTSSGGPKTLDTRIGPLQFTHDFANGYPTPDTLEKLFDERDFQRACQAYLWGLPLVGFAQMQHSAAAELGAANGQIVAFLSYTDKLGILTPNATTPYYIGFVDLAQSGPMVVELPPSGIRAGLVNIWQAGMEGCAPGGKYLILGPGQEQSGDVSGFEILRSSSLGFMIGVRITVTDAAEVQQVLSQLRVYPFGTRDAPSPSEVMKAADRPWSGIPPRGLAYWQRLNDIVQRETLGERDQFFLEMLRPLGIEKGKAFAPDLRQKKLLEQGALVGEAMAKANTYDRRFASVKYRDGARWDHALNLNADDAAEYWTRLDERASWFYEAYSAAADMSPNKPGPSSSYLGAYRDRGGDWFDGGRTYRLCVPPEAPANLFWSVTLYDLNTRSLILNDQNIADRSSRMDLKENDDGSVDIYCGPNAPEGFEQNWIPTVPGKGWFAYFRFYEPTETYFDASWPLPDFERVD